MDTATSYDEVLYPGYAFEQTHPDRISTIAALLGIAAAPPNLCRVLELGCGDGGNLIPMAHQQPGSHFVGLDLSERSIAIGRAAIAELGLPNIELRHASITDVAPDWGSFDYIVAHGVYSWVPAPVRAAIWRILAENLGPLGIGYVGFNALPGGHLRQLARGIMGFHTRHIDDPERRVRQGEAILRHIAEAAPDPVYGGVIREEIERQKRRRSYVIYHDDLSAVNDAFHLHEIVEEGERHGLRYLTDASLARSYLIEHPEGVPEDEVVAREQYRDFVLGTAYREALFCRTEVQPQREANARAVRRLHLSACLTPQGDPLPDPRAPGMAAFRTERGDLIETNRPLAKAAYLSLDAAWPAALSFDGLLAGAMARLGPLGEGWTAERRAEEIESLVQLIWQAFIAGYIGLHRESLPLVRTAGERPEASLLARRQVAHRAVVTSLRHSVVELDEDLVRTFLTLLDGTRTRAELLSALTEAFAGAEEPVRVTPEGVEAHLRVLGRIGLLVR